MEIIQVKFRYKGTRDYIHGTDMFNAIMEASNPSSARSNILFTINDYVRTAMCKLYLTSSKESLEEVKDIAVRCQLDIDGITHWVAIVQDERDSGERERYSYDESQILSLCGTVGEGISLSQLSPYTFIETVVAMTKHMHQQLFPDISGKWVFTRILLPLFCDVKKGLAIRLRHNMNYRLTKSDIEVDGNKVGDIFFSLVNA